MRKGRKHPGGKHHRGAAALFTQGATQALSPGGFASTFFLPLLWHADERLFMTSLTKAKELVNNFLCLEK